MAIIRWEPFRMEDFPEFKIPKMSSDMAIDVFEKGKNIVAEMHIPGIEPEDINIEIEDDYVRISGERAETKEEKESDYYYKEIRRGTFERTFRLPAKVKADKATAEFDEGVLTLNMPKSEEKLATNIKPQRKQKLSPKTKK